MNQLQNINLYLRNIFDRLNNEFNNWKTELCISGKIGMKLIETN
jgi:hypothetical protein